MFKYSIVLEGRGARNQYATFTEDEIRLLRSLLRVSRKEIADTLTEFKVLSKLQDILDFEIPVDNR